MLPQILAFGLFPRGGKGAGMNGGWGAQSKFRNAERLPVGPRKLAVTLHGLLQLHF
jgi:hypothetical protein